MSEEQGSKPASIGSESSSAPASTIQTNPTSPATGLTPGGSASAEPPTLAAGAPPPYAPSYEYEVFQEKKEMPEWARPLITTKEMEDNFRKVFAGHGATEQLVSKRDGYMKELGTLRDEHETLKTQLSDCSDMVDRGDLDGFFKAIGLPTEKVLQYALHHVEYQNLSPEQKKAYDEYVDAGRNNSVLSKKVAELEGRLDSTGVQTRTRDLQSALTRVDVATTVQAIDQKLKAYDQGASFEDEVIKLGDWTWRNKGVDLTADQAVDAVLKKYAQFMGQLPQSAAAPAGQVKPPVIPNVGSLGMSPAKKKITSIADMRKLAASME